MSIIGASTLWFSSTSWLYFLSHNKLVYRFEPLFWEKTASSLGHVKKMKTLNRFLWRINFLLFSFTVSSKVSKIQHLDKSWPDQKKYKTSSKMPLIFKRSSYCFWKTSAFFQEQTHFLLNLLSRHNLNVVPFSYTWQYYIYFFKYMSYVLVHQTKPHFPREVNLLF